VKKVLKAKIRKTSQKNNFSL